MKQSDKNLSGAADLVTFTNGKQLWMSPLTDKDIAELDNWVRSYYLKTQRNSLGEDASEEDKIRVERIAQEVAVNLNWYQGLGMQIMAGVDGMTAIVYISAKKRHPEVTFDEIRALLLDPKNLNEANDKFESLNINSNPQKRGRKKTATQKR